MGFGDIKELNQRDRGMNAAQMRQTLGEPKQTGDTSMVKNGLAAIHTGEFLAEILSKMAAVSS